MTHTDIAHNLVLIRTLDISRVPFEADWITSSTGASYALVERRSLLQCRDRSTFQLVDIRLPQTIHQLDGQVQCTAYEDFYKRFVTVGV